MCPSKGAPYEEQLGYYNYFCQYYFTEEEEHKIDTWQTAIESVYWNMTKRMVLRYNDLLKIIALDVKHRKPVMRMVEILESRKALVRVNKIFNGSYYKKEESKGGFWGKLIP
jgi:hypothetical protein